MTQEKRHIRYQLTSMGRTRDIERLETKAEEDLNFEVIHQAESLKYENMQNVEDERSILKKYALLSILVSPDFMNKVKICKFNFFQ